MALEPIASAAPVPVSVRGLKKAFGRFAALKGVDLDVRPGELIALLGPSGSGKTTLLRAIAGLEFPEEGQVRFGDVDVTHASAAARGVGFVFQQYALFRHMSVAKNIAFGLDVRKRDKPSAVERDRRVKALLKMIELEGMGDRLPAQLSGGQRQRVALARALAVEPRVLLLDEPFGALDATVRKALRRELRRIHDETGVTTIFVTHDQSEALELADRVAVMNAGRIEQIATPAETQGAPATAFVAGFVGEANRIAGDVRGGVFSRDAVRLGAIGVADGPASAFVRPHDLRLTLPEEAGLAATLQRLVPVGGVMRLECRGAQGELWEAEVAAERLDPMLAAGAAVRLTPRSGAVFAQA